MSVIGRDRTPAPTMPLAPGAPRRARIAFVGAGPGDPGLLTVRARELLAAADVLLVDTGVARPLVESCAGPSAEIIDAGVADEGVELTRAARAKLLVRTAQQRAGELGSADDPLLLRAAAFARAHPLAVAAMAGAGLVAGPRRLLRWAGVLLPMLIRLKR